MGGTHTRDTGGKDIIICRSISAASFPPVLAPRVAVNNINCITIICRSISAAIFPPVLAPRVAE